MSCAVWLCGFGRELSPACGRFAPESRVRGAREFVCMVLGACEYVCHECAVAHSSDGVGGGSSRSRTIEFGCPTRSVSGQGLRESARPVGMLGKNIHLSNKLGLRECRTNAAALRFRAGVVCH